MADNQRITNHEEVRDVVLGEFNGCATVGEVAASLIVSKSTVRRYLEEMVERGWATKIAFGSSGYSHGVAYNVSPEHADSDW